MAKKKKITGNQLKMSFNLPAKTKNTASDAFKKATQPVKSYGTKAAENVSKKAPSTAVVKSGTNYPAVKSNKSTAVAKNASTVNKAKLLGSGKSAALAKASKIAQQAPKYTDFVEIGKKTSKGKDIKGKAMLAVYGAAALTAAAASGAFDKKKETAVKTGAKKATSTVKKPDTKKVETKKPITKTSNPKFVKGYIEGLERQGTKKTASKKPVTSSKVIGAVKATVTGKNTNKIETNLKKDTPKVNNTSIEQKAKDVMSGKYGSGAARKKALGADYDKVQAIINKQMAGSKAKSTSAKTVTAPAAPEKMEIKKAQPIEYAGPTELAIPKPVVKEEPSRREQKREDRKEAKEYRKEAKEDAKKEKMRKGGMVKKMQYGGVMKTKKK